MKSIRKKLREVPYHFSKTGRKYIFQQHHTPSLPYLCGFMGQLPHDTIKPFSGEQGKKEQIGAMFDRIAVRYDFMNRFLSAGIDTGWRIKAIKKLKPLHPKHILDVATGTGDMAIRAFKILQPHKITGIDLSAKMLEIGRRKVAAEQLTESIELLEGDSEKILWADNTFDAAMVAFGVRNFENLHQGLQEILRVLKPGAQLVVLEFSQPRNNIIRMFYDVYMSWIAPQIARLFGQNKQAYQYLNKSARAFPDRQHFVDILQEAGYTHTSFQALTFGICCIYCGFKPPTNSGYQNGNGN